MTSIVGFQTGLSPDLHASFPDLPLSATPAELLANSMVRRSLFLQTFISAKILSWDSLLKTNRIQTFQTLISQKYCLAATTVRGSVVFYLHLMHFPRNKGAEPRLTYSSIQRQCNI